MTYKTRETRLDPHRFGDSDADIKRRMRELEDKLARLTCEQGTVAVRRHGPAKEPAGAPAGIGLTDRLGAIGVRPKGRKNLSRAREPADTEFENLERTLEDLTAHIARSEHSGKTALASVRDRIALLGSSAVAAPGNTSPPGSSSLERIGHRLSALSARIDERDDPPPDRSAVALEDQIIGLVEKIEDTMADAGSGSPGGTGGAELPVSAESDEDFQKLARRLHQIRANSTTPGLAEDEPRQPGLRNEIARVSTELADLRERVRNDDELARIGAELARVSDLVETSDPWSRPDSPVSRIEGRIAELARQFEEILSGVDESPQIAALEARIAEIADRIDDALDAPGDDVAVQALEQQISRLASRLEATEQRHGDIQTIEDNISQLFENIEQSRQFASEAAENAAAGVARSLSETGTSGGSSSATLAALEKGLRSVRKNAESADARTQKTLEVVHGTLKTVITRLAALEAGAQSAQAALMTAAPESDGGVKAPSVAPAHDEGAALRDDGAQKGTGSADIDTLKLPPVEPAELSDDHTGDDALGSRAGPAKADRDVFPGRDTIGPGPDAGNDKGAPGKVARNEDFIAAARRAARAAIEPPSGEPLNRLGGLKPGFLRSHTDGQSRAGPAPKKPDGTKRKHRFRRKSKPAATPASGKPPSSGSRRPLLMAAVLLLMIGTVSAYSLFGSGGEKLPLAKPGAAPAGDKAAPASSTPRNTAPEHSSTRGAPTSANREVAARRPDGDGGGDASPGPQTAGTPAVARRTLQNVKRPMLPADTEITTNSIPITGIWPTGTLLTRPGEAVSMPGEQLSRSGAGTAADGASAAPSKATVPRARKADLVAPSRIGNDDTITTASVPPSPTPKQLLPPEKIGSKSLRLAAASGDPIAQFEIAGRYIEGKVIAQDFRLAAYWYQLAAARGLAPAQYRLGTLYEKGRGVPRDISAARIWYERAAEKGNRKAMHNLAVIYASGVGRDPDFGKAAAWFARASQLGLADSQYNLAILHERGFGVKADPVAAYKWFVLAARTGDKDAGRRSQALAEKLDPSRLAEAKIEIGTWRPQPLNKTANVVVLRDKSWAGAPAKFASDNRSLLSEVQRLLNSHGFKAGIADGVMGGQTRRAIRQFQRRNGMTGNGLVTPVLVKRLRSYSG